MEPHQIRPTHVEVDLGAIKRNVVNLRQCAPTAQLMAVVKADGYGHGALPVAKAALEAGATWLGVAILEEALELRRAGLDVPILIFGYVPPDRAAEVVRYDLRPALFDRVLAEALDQQGRAQGRKAKVHLKVDTGMGRVGIPFDRAVDFARWMEELPHLEVEGLFTHFAVADEPDNPFTGVQIDRFESARAALRSAGIEPPVVHACNSAGLMLHPRAHYSLVRAGIALYGLPPDPKVRWPVELVPALSWRTRVSMVKTVPAGSPISYGCTYRTQRTERIATLPVGYADGYSRLLSNRAEVLIHGRRCPVVGRVCMDQTMVRLPDDLEVRPGDEVVLIGKQGTEKISASDLAGLIGTINYEIVCAIGRRVPRLYRKDESGLVGPS
jgi:alanine racemase